MDNNRNIELICKECSEMLHSDWQDHNKETVIIPGDYVKIKFQDDNGSEHMWVVVTSVNKNHLEGVLDNKPVAVTCVKYMDKVKFEFSDIEKLIREN